MGIHLNLPGDCNTIAMRTKGIVFDFDGVLGNTEKHQFQAWNDVLKPYGMRITEKEYIRFVGRTIRDNAMELRRMGLDRDVSGDREKRVMELMRDGIETMPFAKEAVEKAISLGIRVAVATNSLRNEMDFKLGRSGLDGMFRVKVCRSDVGRGKPFPDIYLKAAELLELEPRECAAVEDTHAGLKAAREAGMFCIAVPNQYNKGEAFPEAGLVLRDLSELLGWMEQAGTHIQPG